HLESVSGSLGIPSSPKTACMEFLASLHRLSRMPRIASLVIFVLRSLSRSPSLLRVARRANGKILDKAPHWAGSGRTGRRRGHLARDPGNLLRQWGGSIDYRAFPNRSRDLIAAGRKHVAHRQLNDAFYVGDQQRAAALDAVDHYRHSVRQTQIVQPDRLAPGHVQ